MPMPKKQKAKIKQKNKCPEKLIRTEAAKEIAEIDRSLQAVSYTHLPEDIKEKEECNNDHAKSEYTENQACEKFLQFSSHGWQASFSEDS